MSTRAEIKGIYWQLIKWQEFLDTFKSTIHKNKNQQNIDKCNYLRSQLMGQGSEMLIRIKLSNDNYNNAAAILKKRHGKNQAMIDSHYAHTNNIPVVSYKTASLCQFYKCTEKHLHVLSSSGESNNQNNVLTMMRLKLPRSVLLRLDEHDVTLYQRTRSSRL